MPNFMDIERTYNKDKNLKKENVQMLIEWVKEQPHLPNINEIQAIIFFQKSNYDIINIKLAIDQYFTFKTSCANIFLDRNPQDILFKKTLDALLVTTLPKKTPEGYTIFFLKMIDKHADSYKISHCMKYVDMICSLYLHEEGPNNGCMLVCDIGACPYDLLKQFDYIELKTFFYYITRFLPWRFMSLHYFNLVPFMDEILKILKPAMPKELLEVLYVDSTMDDLTQYVPKDCLPKDYGGSAEETSVLHEKVKRKLLDNVSFFEWENKQTVDESKRSEALRTSKDIFGEEIV